MSFINPVFSITLSSEESFILKINNHQWNKKLQREIDAMELARSKTSLPIPQIFAYDFDKTIIPYDYVIMEQVVGEQFGELRYSGKLDTEALLEIYYSLGNYLGQLHSIKFDFFLYISKNNRTAEAKQNKKITYNSQLFGTLGFINQPSLQAQSSFF